MGNSCTGAIDYGSIIYYSHLIPVLITAVLSVFILLKSHFSFLSKIFFAFTTAFCLWLLGDVVAWASRDYNLISFVWASLDYLNIIFYLLGAYFFMVLVKGRDISIQGKVMLFTLSLPAWFLAVTNQSITVFNQPACEGFNNDFLTLYKVVIEMVITAFIIIYSAWSYRKAEKKKQIIFVATGLVLFFTVFSITEYIASRTGFYEINLYSLFILPVFLGIIIYSIINLNIFQVRLLGTQLMVYVLLIMVGSQFFFLESSTDKTLTILTLAIASFLGYLLVRSSKRESEARQRIESLVVKLGDANTKLTELDKVKNEFLSFATHQLRSPLTSMSWGMDSLNSAIKQGKLGDNDVATFEHIQSTTQDLIGTVNDLLDLSKIEQGGLVMQKENFDLHSFVADLVNEFHATAEHKGLALIFESKARQTMIFGDRTKLRQVFVNLIDNAIKYTKQGSVKVFLSQELGNTIKISVKDTGPGISNEEKDLLFDKFVRGKAGHESGSGSGLGLHLAKKIVELHKGTISVLTEAGEAGSTFVVTLPISE